MNHVRKITFGEILMYLFIALFAFFCLVPFLLSLIVSFSSEESIMLNGYSFFPSEWSVEAYRMIFASGSKVMQAFALSCIVTVVGTLLAVWITIMAAFSLSNAHVYYRDQLSLFFFITMLFSTGLVPWYMVCKMVGLYDNFWALVIPSLLFSPFNLFLCRNFMKGIPASLYECAVIDGANDMTIAFRIYVPLSLPVIATITLFYGLNYWNDWWNAIMLTESRDLYPIQYLLLQLRSQVNMIKDMQRNLGGGQSVGMVPTESVKMATSIVTIGPIVLLYPFLQKYFISGLTIGSVKG